MVSQRTSITKRVRNGFDGHVCDREAETEISSGYLRLFSVVVVFVIAAMSTAVMSATVVSTAAVAAIVVSAPEVPTVVVTSAVVTAALAPAIMAAAVSVTARSASKEAVSPIESATVGVSARIGAIAVAVPAIVVAMPHSLAVVAARSRTIVVPGLLTIGSLTIAAASLLAIVALVALGVIAVAVADVSALIVPVVVCRVCVGAATVISLCPWPCTDKDSAYEVARRVVAIRSTLVGIGGVVAVGAIWRLSCIRDTGI